MKAYTVYNDNNFWTIHQLIRELMIYLKNELNAETYTQKGGWLNIESINYNMPDCELIIYDEKKDILKAVSYSETRTRLWDIFGQRNNKNDILVIVHECNWKLDDYNHKSHKFKLKKTTFYPFSPKINYNYYYHKRKFIKYEDMDDRVFLRTSTGRGDEKEMSQIGFTCELFPPMSIENYLERAITHKVGLSIAGHAELCHRDFDYMAIGLPNMRMEFVGKYEPELISNYHYIAVPRNGLPADSNLDKRGGNVYIEAYKNRYEEVKNDYDFLDFISKNAQDYFLKYCESTIKINLLIERLELWKTS